MKTKLNNCILLATLAIQISAFAQVTKDTKELVRSNGGYVSVGGRSTLSAFDSDGLGLGSGGHLRVQINNRVNTEWMFDYISINSAKQVHSEYYHVGWSVMYYPFEDKQYPKLVQPYIMAGHCFDYNIKTEIVNPANSQNRWGSAVQAGVGTHFNLSERFDISLSCQYMIHLTKELEAENTDHGLAINEAKASSLEGHLLTTVSFNYKLFKLWNRN